MRPSCLIDGFAFLHDSRVLVVWSNGGTIELWDTSKGECRLRLKIKSRITRLSIPDDGYIETDRGKLEGPCLRARDDRRSGEVFLCDPLVKEECINIGNRQPLLERDMRFGTDVKFAVKGRVVVLGNALGDVLIIHAPETGIAEEDWAAIEAFVQRTIEKRIGDAATALEMTEAKIEKLQEDLDDNGDYAEQLRREIEALKEGLAARVKRARGKMILRRLRRRGAALASGRAVGVQRKPASPPAACPGCLSRRVLLDSRSL